MTPFSRFGLAFACALTAWVGCRSDDQGEPPTAGSNSNWLRRCTEDGDCDGLACVCGACGGVCITDADCADLIGARCAHAESPATRSLCFDGASDMGVCLPRCAPGECEDGRACVDGACIRLDFPDVTYCADAADFDRFERALEDRLLELIQGLRLGGGSPCGTTEASPAPLLRVDPRLTCIARARALDIESAGAFDEVDSAGRTPEARFAEVSYAASVWGESFAIAATSAESALEFMRQETASCLRLSDPAFVDIGVGATEGVAIVLIGSE